MNIRRLLPFALFCLLLAVAVRPTVDPDLWWHLRTGEAILSGGIPRTDLFSFTYPTNEWITHEWLSQLTMWGLYRLAGLGALIVFFAAVIAATWGLIYRISDGKPYVAGMVVVVAVEASAVAWGSRPQLFNLLLLAVFVFLLERRKDNAVGRWVFLAFPALTLLWANLHSGYLLGIVVLCTYLIGDFLEGRRSNPNARTLPAIDLIGLSIAIVVASLASLFNPNGIRLWLYPFETLFSPVQRDFIAEWFPPNPTQAVFWLLAGLVVAGILGFILTARRPSITELLVFGGTAVGAFLSVRNIPIFAVASTPILCRYLATVFASASWSTPKQLGKSQRLSTLLAAGAIGAGAAAIAAATLVGNTATVRSTFPEAAVDWIESGRRVDDRIFNAYNWGGYLIWRGYPVYVDGRADVYGDAGLLNFAQTYLVEPGWEEPLDRYQIELILVESDSALAGTLTKSIGWELAYEDSIARVFERAERLHITDSIPARSGDSTLHDRRTTGVGDEDAWTVALTTPIPLAHRVSR